MTSKRPPKDDKQAGGARSPKAAVPRGRAQKGKAGVKTDSLAQQGAVSTVPPGSKTKSRAARGKPTASVTRPMPADTSSDVQKRPSGEVPERRVLSIDGGGIRGVIPAVVLQYLEDRAGKPISALFDLVVGTSTGGILGLGLTLPQASSSVPGQAPNEALPGQPSSAEGLPRYSAADILSLYEQEGARIFSRSAWRSLRSVGGALDEAYPHEPLEAVLASYFGDALLGDCLIPSMVTAYDIEARCTLFLKSWREAHQQVRLRDACRATSAAPTFFEPHSLEVGPLRRPVIDGGVFINSPAVSAYAEARKLFPQEPIAVLSLGTGELTRPIPLDEAVNWGKLGWVQPLIDCMFDGSAKAADHQMTLFLGNRYQRLQARLDYASDSMDDASKGNIQNLARTGEALVYAHQAELERWLR